MKFNAQETIKRAEEDYGLGKGQYFKVQEGPNKIRLLSPCIPYQSEFKGQVNVKFVCWILDRQDNQIKVYFKVLSMHKVLSLTLILALTVMSYAQGGTGPQANAQSFDVIIRGGTVYDGTGRAPVKGDVGISGDRIAAVGNLSRATAPTIVDAKGLAVAPGYQYAFAL